MTPPAPDVSVIVPTYDRPQALEHCLEALAAQVFPGEMEVIVVDDGGSSPLAPLIEARRDDLDLTLIQQDNSGPGAARNRGARAARGELLVFTDDDCLPDPSWVAELLAHHRQNPEVLIGGATQTRSGRNLYSDTAQFILDCAYRFYNSDPADAGFHASNNMAVGRKKFLATGGFDETFRIASEDREFCGRWRLHHGRIHELDSALVIHAKELSLRAYVRQFFRYGHGAWQYRRFRKQAGSGDMAGSEPHAAFLRCVFREWRKLPRGSGLRMLGLLGLWQVSNLAGFLFGAAHNGWYGPGDKSGN